MRVIFEEPINVRGSDELHISYKITLADNGEFVLEVSEKWVQLGFDFEIMKGE